MRRRKLPGALAGALATAVLLLAAPLAAAASPPDRSLDPGTRFFVPVPDKAGVKQAKELLHAGRTDDAAALDAMLAEGHAVWFTGGKPNQVRHDVAETMKEAARQDAVPVLVAYDIPYRDCGQYSAGGAASTEDYLAWIDAFAAGIGDGKAIVLLEPDGLGIIPWYRQFAGWPEESADYGSCRPVDADGDPAPGATPADRFAQLNAAVDRLEQQPGASVYLDGTHSNWLGAGDIADRLIKAGVERAQGFFLNVSNYQPTPQLEEYGGWIAACVAVTATVSWWHPYWCPSQYYPATASDYGTWHLTDEAYATSVEPNIPAGTPRPHFVIDTSRNGQGPWHPTVSYPDAQDWCNPPGRGAGDRQTADTGVPLLDAKLWVKVPGESDGSCNRGIAGSTTDPEWGGIVDPPAGAWFPQQALQLAQLANPPLP